MRKAGQYHLSVGIIIALLGLIAYQTQGLLRAMMVRDRLLVATTEEVPNILKEVNQHRSWITKLLQNSQRQAEEQSDLRKQLRTSLALLPADKRQGEKLYNFLLVAEPPEFMVIRKELQPYKTDFVERLWEIIENPRADQDQRLRAASALAEFSPQDPRWESNARLVASILIVQKPFVIGPWTTALKRVGKWLTPSLLEFLIDEKKTTSEAEIIAAIYGAYAEQNQEAYAQLEMKLSDPELTGSREEDKVIRAKRDAIIGSALLAMGKPEKVWPLLRHQPDPSRKSFLIERISSMGVNPSLLIEQLELESDVSVRRAILLSLGSYRNASLSQIQRERLSNRLQELYRDDPDSGIHGAAEWVLRTSGMEQTLQQIEQPLMTGKPEGSRQWYINRQNQTMAVIVKPDPCMIYAEGGRFIDVKLNRSFAISTKEVTVEQFRRFKDYSIDQQSSPIPKCPVNSVRWFQAAEYCNWLNEQEGIPKDEWCYLPNKNNGQYDAGTQVLSNILKRTGYRLPTDVEWEYSCRAGALTNFSFSAVRELLPKYAWCAQNSFRQTQPVGLLKPNDLGISDMHGNVWELTQPAWESLRPNEVGPGERKMRGGSYLTEEIAKYEISYFATEPLQVRTYLFPVYPPKSVGFRLARTLQNSPDVTGSKETDGNEKESTSNTANP